MEESDTRKDLEINYYYYVEESQEFVVFDGPWRHFQLLAGPIIVRVWVHETSAALDESFTRSF